ncbi:MAG TPA: dihydrolipoamide acyltransferase [Bacteroidales bacterium]|nr:dihydrolipoamide acyltransferase [Bacteroidales bacterium]
MEFNLSIGLSALETQRVTANTTARHYGSGLVDVFATPAMIAMMEKAAMSAVQSKLPEGYNTVGVEVSVTHTKATPKGMKVKSEATLKEVNGNKLLFEVVAWDEEGVIGKGTHRRSIVETEKFMSRIRSK